MRGKAVDGAGQSEGGEDHPRVCGEKARTLIVQNEPQGSPPRMRGKALTDPCIALCHGITPACAGKRPLPSFPVLSLWDHPRVCGEKYLLSRTSMCTKGSPPRVRGKGETACEVVVKFGITPAYAGKRACTTTAIIQPKDHPRVCGEKGRAGGAGSWSWSELRWLLTRFPVKVIDTV